MMIIFLPVISKMIVIYGTVATFVHMIIDGVKFKLIIRKQKKTALTSREIQNVFFIDQFLHLCTLFAVAYLFTIRGENLLLHDIISRVFLTADISVSKTLSWITALLIVHKPTNVAISKILLNYRPKKKNDNGKNAGRFVGTIERVIILIFIAVGQYAAIGLVLTAKSIARYDKITKDPDFAEHYLLGTLLSTVAAIITSFIIQFAV